MTTALLPPHAYFGEVQSIDMARFAKTHIVLLVLYQHARLTSRVRLMASETVHLDHGLGFWIQNVCYRVIFRGVSETVFQR